VLRVKEIVNSIFTSKTYILYREGVDRAWLVDIGDIEPVMAFCVEQGLTIEGVFLTHTHFDHIYGILSLLEQFPDCKVYTNEYGKQALASAKLNMSRYHEMPIVYEGGNVVLVHEGEEFCLIDNEPVLIIHETPGHNPSCLTMILGNMIFTGDSYIPTIRVNTLLPHADKELAKLSLERILKLAEGKTIFSGHKIDNNS
jgi:glyoxylase-like metal-dependent hydrolase (beta-lactamase superfamily II)